MNIDLIKIYLDGDTDGGGGESYNLEQKTTTITTNGTTTIVPSEGYDAMAKVNIDTAVIGSLDGLNFSLIGYNETDSDDCNAETNDKITYSKTLYDAWDPNNTSASGLYRDDTKLVYAPAINIDNVTDMSNMFRGCSSLIYLPYFDTSNVTVMNDFIRGCSSLTSVPLFNTSNNTHFNSFFRDCGSLTEIPLFDLSSCIYCDYMFNGCSSLTSIPELNTPNITIANYMFSNCYKLTSIPQLDFGKVTSISTIFGYSNINTLTDLGGFKNLKINWNDSYGLARCPNLTYQSVMNVINGLYDFRGNGDTTTTRTIKFNSNSVALLSDEDKAIATNKGWIIAQ